MEFPTGFVSEIESIPTINEAEFKDVNFYDYDGTRLYSYTAEEFLALSAFPANPSHDLLTADGWNWDFNVTKTYVRKYGACEIGQNYHPTDGSTLIRITLEDGDDLTVTFKVQGTIDWGDGSAQETYSGTQNDRSHTYSSAGNYIIHVTNTSSWCPDGSQENKDKIKEINLGSGVTSIGTNQIMKCCSLEKLSFTKNSITQLTGINALGNLYRLKGLVFPYGLTQTTTSVAYGLWSAKCVCFPSTISGSLYLSSGFKQRQCTFPTGTTSILGYGNDTRRSCNIERIIFPDGCVEYSSNSFNGVPSLKSVRYPATVTSTKITDNQSFAACYSLEELTIPEGVKTLQCFSDLFYCKKLVLPSTAETMAGFTNLYLCREIHIKATVPPTKSSTTSLNNHPSYCKIYVPYSEDHSVINAYKTETNWSLFADKYVEETPLS